MLQTALIGLLAGSLAIGAPDTGDDKKNPDADKATTQDTRLPGVFDTAQDPETIQDTYAFGRSSAASPIKFWVSFGWGEAESIWDRTGDTGELALAAGTPLQVNGDIVSQRANVGAQIDFLNLPAFKVGAGAQLTVAKNAFQVGSDGDPAMIGDLESDFGLQGVKVYGQARGPVVGVHGGYLFDLGSEGEDRIAQLPIGPGGVLVPVELPASLANSDGRDAINIGADFDYPSERFRLFGGIDHFLVQGIDEDGADDFNGDVTNFMFGGGVKFSVVELGASLQIQTVSNEPTVANIGTTSGISSHAGTVAPYLRISPPSLPASLFIKGAVQEEYTEFGYPIGGSNSVKPSIGFTAGLTVGFE